MRTTVTLPTEGMNQGTMLFSYSGGIEAVACTSCTAISCFQWMRYIHLQDTIKPVLSDHIKQDKCLAFQFIQQLATTCLKSQKYLLFYMVA